MTTWRVRNWGGGLSRSEMPTLPAPSEVKEPSPISSATMARVMNARERVHPSTIARPLPTTEDAGERELIKSRGNSHYYKMWLEGMY